MAGGVEVRRCDYRTWAMMKVEASAAAKQDINLKEQKSDCSPEAVYKQR
jgi:hypothetical protein